MGINGKIVVRLYTGEIQCRNKKQVKEKYMYLQ